MSSLSFNRFSVNGRVTSSRVILVPVNLITVTAYVTVLKTKATETSQVRIIRKDEDKCSFFLSW